MKLKYINDQVNGSIVELVNSIRQEDLDRALNSISRNLQSELSQQDINFARALAQVDHVQQLVNSPEKILGRMDTKHGELAEQVEVAIQNSKTLLHGKGYCATADPKVVGRTVNAPTDYIIRGVNVQSKFINGEANTLTHVINHLKKYDTIGFGRDNGSYYHIPEDQYDIIIEAIKTGKIDGRRLSSAESILSKVKEIEQLTGRKFTDAVKPAHVKYGEVQWGKIDGTLERIRFDISEENEKIVKEINENSERKKIQTVQSHQPSLNEAIKIGGVSATISGGITLISSVYAKTKEGKTIEQFSMDDWKDVGVNTVDASLRGGVSGMAIYGLTNCVGMPAPIAAGTVSAIIGIGDLVVKYNKHEISSEQLFDKGKLLCINSAAATIGSIVGQELIPIPILGSVIGSIAGTYCVEILSSLLNEKDIKKIQCNYKDLNETVYEYLKPLTERYGRLIDLMEISFDINSNYELRLLSSQQIAMSSGVSQLEILYNIGDIDAYFLT